MMTDSAGKPAPAPASPPAAPLVPAAPAAPAAKAPESPSPPAQAESPRPDTTLQALPASPHAPSTLRFKNPGATLPQLIEGARAGLYKAKTAAERDEIAGDLSRKLTTDTTLSEVQLLEQMNRVRDRMAGPHDGEVRTYPSPKTEEVWERILNAFTQALTNRRPAKD